MYFNRSIEQAIKSELDIGQKIIILYGPRQVGKTTLIQTILANYPQGKTLKINADETKYSDLLSSRDAAQLESLVSGYDILFIDEAQRINNIGINLKILHDHFPNLKIIVTGSSSLDLAGKIKEPLTGRTHTFTLFPISTLELSHRFSQYEIKEQLNNRLIYGSYPDILTELNTDKKIKRLTELSEAYLYKDILSIGNIRNPYKLSQLLTLLAYQIGNEVSYSELSKNLDISKETVQSYIDLLEKSFVLVRLHGYSRNLRKEVTKMPKIYFLDLGIRNSLIRQYLPLHLRQDKGAIWENFCIIERIKRNHYLNHFARSYFWRTYTGAELDYIEDYNGVLNGSEFKYSQISKVNVPKTFAHTYPNHTFECITQDNFLKFVTA